MASIHNPKYMKSKVERLQTGISFAYNEESGALEA